MKSSRIQLRKRGYIEDDNLGIYHHLSKSDLLKLLHSDIATERSISARLLGQHNSLEVIEALISRLSVERKLYTKIELSENLANCGATACKPLVRHLGAIGNNQHKVLPSQVFKKSNYPLPRDIVARTICKIGQPALKELNNCLTHGEYTQLLEAVDAIGFISFYENDLTSEEYLLSLMVRYKEDHLMLWKILRAFQAFKSERVKNILREYSTSDLEGHRLEAIRSLRQIKRRTKIT